MIAGTFFKELVEKQDIPAQAKDGNRAITPETHPPFKEVHFERCCLPADISQKKKINS